MTEETPVAVREHRHRGRNLAPIPRERNLAYEVAIARIAGLLPRVSTLPFEWRLTT